MRNLVLSIVILPFMINVLSEGAEIEVTNGNDSGAGSLREAISSATAGDSIVYAPSGGSPGSQLTTTLLSTLSITKDLEKISNGAIYDISIAKGNNYTNIVVHDATVYFEGINITPNLAIQNSADVTIDSKNVQGSLAVNPTLTFQGDILGDGTLTLKGLASDTFKVTGNVTYTGDLNIQQTNPDVTQGLTTIQLDKVVNTKTTTIAENAALQLNSLATTTLNNVTGAGSLIKQGALSATISGNASYEGSTTVNQGTLVFSGAVTDLPSNFLGSGNVEFNSSSNQLFSGDFSGELTLNKTNSGTTTLSGALTTSMPISVEGTGTLALTGDVSNLESNILVDSGASLNIGSDGDNQIFSDDIASEGTVNKKGSNRVTLAGTLDMDASSALNVEEGLLSLAGDINDLLAPISISEDADLVVNQRSDVTLASDLSGQGTFINVNSGVTTLTGTVNLEDFIINSAGTLLLTGDATNTALQVDGGGNLILAPEDDQTFLKRVNVFDGYLIKQGSQTVTLTGALSSEGTEVSPVIQVQEGTLVLNPSSYDFTGNYQVLSNSTLNFADIGAPLMGESSTYANNILGSGDIVISGSEDVTLSYDNLSYTGDTSITGKSLTLSGNLTDFTSDISIGSSSSLILAPSSSQFLSGEISGAGTIVKKESGKTTLTGDLSLTGIASISGGTLVLPQETITPGLIAIESQGILELGGLSDQTVSSVFSGSGTLNKVLSSETTLTGAFSGFSGTANINEGVLTLPIIQEDYSANFAIASGAVLNATSSFSKNITGKISGEGTLLKAGSGTLNLTNSSLGVKSIDLQAGTLSFGENVTGNKDLAIDTSLITSVYFAHSGVQKFSFSSLSGDASLIKEGNGRTILLGDPSYKGVTEVNAGVLDFRGNVDNLPSNIVLTNAGSTLNFSAGNNISQTLTGSISGLGSVQHSGNATTTLSGALTYEGNTKVKRGILALTSDLSNFSSDIQVNSNGTLQLGNSSSQVLSSDISGSGALTKVGLGTTTLSGTVNLAGGIDNQSGVLNIRGDSSNTPVTLTSGTINVGTTGSQTFSKQITFVDGSFVKQNSGTVTLEGALVSDASTLDPVIRVQEGLLNVTPSSYSFNGDYQVIAGRLHLGDIGSNQTSIYNNPISGNGVVAVIGSRDVRLSSDYLTGLDLIFVSGKSLDLSGNFQNLSSNLEVESSSTLKFSPSESQVVWGNLFGEGNIIKQGRGQTSIFGNVTEVASAKITNGVLALGGSVVSTDFNIESNGTLALNPSAFQSLTGNVTGQGTFRKSGQGITRMSGTFSGFKGTTFLDEGEFVLPDVTETINSKFYVASGAILNSSADNDKTFSKALEGPGSLLKRGSGSLNLKNPKLDLGLIVLEGGDLSFGKSVKGNDNLLISTSLGTTLNFDSNTDQMFSFSTITGSAQLNKSGTGVTTLYGNVAYEGDTTIYEGTLAFRDSIENFPGNIVVDSSSATLAFGAGNNLSQIFSGDISGAGSVTHNSTGTTTLRGNLSYSGNTTVSKGTLALESDLSNLSGDANVKSGATLQVGSNTNQTYFSNILGAGSLKKVGIGNTTLLGSLAHSGTTFVNEGVLIAQSDMSATGTINVSEGAFFQDNITADHTLQNMITGAGGFVKGATGVTTLNNPLDYTGRTRVNVGTLDLTGVLSNFQSDFEISQTGQLNLGGASNIVQNLTGNITGDGAVLKKGLGETTLFGTLDYKGLTTVEAGTLLLSGDIASLSGGFATAANGTLALGSSNDQVINSGIIGLGNLKKVGSGKTRIVSPVAYAGTTTIEEGILSLEGDSSSLAGDVNVNLGATLEFGTLSSQTINTNITGDGKLSKILSGATTLSGSLSNDGETLISNGSIILTGDVSNWASPIVLQRSGDIGGILEDAISSNHTLSNTISGEGVFTKTTSSNLNLTGDLTEFKGATIIGGGSLTLNQALSEFDNSILIYNDSTLVVGSNKGDQNITGTLYGEGSITKVGSKTTTFSGRQNFSGEISVTNGTLGLFLEADDMPANVSLASGTTLMLGSAESQTLSGDVSGSGKIRKVNEGLTRLSGHYTNTGTVTIEEGVLALSGKAFTLPSTVRVLKEGFFSIESAEIVTISSNITGAGGFILSSRGQNELSNGFTYSGDTKVLSGGLNVNTGVSGYKGNISLGTNADLNLGGSSNQTLLGDITGTGNIYKAGSSQLILSGDLSYSGFTYLTEGGMSINGMVSNLPSNIIISDSLVLNVGSQSNQLLSGNIEGLGSVRKTSSGLTEIQGKVSYLGTTSVEKGELRFSGDISELSGTVSVSKGATLGVKQEEDSTLRLSLQGEGNFAKEGRGELTIDQDFGLTGNVFVNSGVLVVNSDLGLQDFYVQESILAGSGTVGSILNNGAVKAGNSIGTLSVVGDYIQRSGVLANEFNATSSCLVQAGGVARIYDGSTLLLGPDSSQAYDEGTTFTILTADQGVRGEFTNIDFTRNSVFDKDTVELAYLDNSVQLILRPNTHIYQTGQLQSELALKSSQAQLDNFKAVNNRNLYSYDWCSEKACAKNSKDNNEPNNKENCSEFPCKNQGFDLYALTSYTNYDLKKTSQRRGGHVKVSATTLGAEYVFDDFGSLGAGFGYTYGQVNHPGGFNTKTDMQAFTFGMNALYAPIKYISFDFAGNIDKVWYSTKRQTTTYYTNTDAKSSPEGLQANASLRIMPRLCVFSILMQPFFSSQYNFASVDAYSESGPLNTTFRVGKTSLSYWSGEAGGMLSTKLKMNSLCLIPHINASYVFKYNSPTDNVSVTNRASGVQNYNTIDNITTNYVKLGGGLDLLNKESFRVFVEANAFIKDAFNSSFDARCGLNVYF